MPAASKDAQACCARHNRNSDMKAEDGKEMASCCGGKDVVAGGKDAPATVAGAFFRSAAGSRHRRPGGQRYLAGKAHTAPSVKFSPSSPQVWSKRAR